MKEKDKKILEIIIKDYVATGVPVGSSRLVEKYKLGVSSATIRNVMVELEDDGFIMHPHTSSGRVPTEKAFRMIVSELKEKKEIKRLKDKDILEIDNALNIKDELTFKEAAKIISKIADSAVFWAFHKHNLYYTGISNLFKQPEFIDSGLIHNISEVIDRMDDIINNIFDTISFDPEIFIGEENPFGDFTSTIMVKYRHGDNVGLFGILAPTRTDYEANLSLIKHVLSKLR